MSSKPQVQSLVSASKIISVKKVIICKTPKVSISNKSQIINKRSRDDFELTLKFIEKAHPGVDMNTSTFRSPTKIYINDASEHSLGEFAIHGRAWSRNIPQNIQGHAHINLLEFLSQLVSIWIDVIEKRIEPLHCILATGDNTGMVT